MIPEIIAVHTKRKIYHLFSLIRKKRIVNSFVILRMQSCESPVVWQGFLAEFLMLRLYSGERAVEKEPWKAGKKMGNDTFFHHMCAQYLQNMPPHVNETRYIYTQNSLLSKVRSRKYGPILASYKVAWVPEHFNRHRCITFHEASLFLAFSTVEFLGNNGLVIQHGGTYILNGLL